LSASERASLSSRIRSKFGQWAYEFHGNLPIAAQPRNLGVLPNTESKRELGRPRAPEDKRQ